MNQVSTTEPCPYCQTHTANIRCDKSAIEISRETLMNWATGPRIFTVTDRWRILQSNYKAFYKEDEIFTAKGNEPDNYFYPNNGSHPVYGIYSTFIFDLSFAETIEYTLRPEDHYIIQIIFTYNNQTIDITHSLFALKLWDKYFDEEYLQMKKDAESEKSPSDTRIFSCLFTKSDSNFNEITNGTIILDHNDNILDARGPNGYYFDTTGYKIDIIK